MNSESEGAHARVAAARALIEVLDRGHNLGDALAKLERRLQHAPDRAKVRRLCNRVLRDYPALEWRLGQLLKKAIPRKTRVVHFLLLSALDELREAREPAAAVVHASVAATRLAGQPHLAGLVNAVLRNHQRRADQLDAAMPADPTLRLGYPSWLLDALAHDWPDHWADIAAAGNQPPPLWLRVNRRRAQVSQVREELGAANHPGATHAHFADALKLEHHARVSDLPGFVEGRISVQDAGAQQAVELLDLHAGQRVLDACAAPGGKAAHALERADIELTAVERDATRARRIGETFQRLGLAGEIIVGDAAHPEQWWSGQPFDRILVDAPCSAIGVLRRHPDIRWLHRASDIADNIDLQQRLLRALWPLLKPGGLLVYATCSILHGENRDQARSFLDSQPDAEVVPATIVDSIETGPGNQILPGSLDRDGFYYLRLRRLR